MKHSKGGFFSPFYADVYLVIDWHLNGTYLEAERKTSRVYAYAIVPSKHLYFRPGLTWPRRTQGGLRLRAMSQGCIFADKGPAAFVADDASLALLALLALTKSRAFYLLVSLQMAFGSYEVGVIQKTPVPDLNEEQQYRLAYLARRAWSLKRTLDTVEETSHAFLLPVALRVRLGDYDPPAIEAELARIQAEIDELAFDLYGFAEADRAAAQFGGNAGAEGGADANEGADQDSEGDDSAAPIDHSAGLLAWAMGVAFGRFPPHREATPCGSIIRRFPARRSIPPSMISSNPNSGRSAVTSLVCAIRAVCGLAR